MTDHVLETSAVQRLFSESHLTPPKKNPGCSDEKMKIAIWSVLQQLQFQVVKRVSKKVRDFVTAPCGSSTLGQGGSQHNAPVHVHVHAVGVVVLEPFFVCDHSRQKSSVFVRAQCLYVSSSSRSKSGVCGETTIYDHV